VKTQGVIPVDKLVVIDAGHDSDAPGACRNGLRECDVTLNMAERVGHYVRLLSRDDRGQPRIRTVMTRSNGGAVSIDYRAWIARQAARETGPAANPILLAIHCNSSLNPMPRGAEILLSPDGGYRQMSGRIAAELLARLDAVGMRSRGVKPATKPHINYNYLGLLRGTHWHLAGVYLELGFLSNARDAAMLRDPDSREVLAIAIAATLCADGHGIRPRMELVASA